MADILDGLASLSPQQLTYEQRLAAQIKAITDGPKQLLLAWCQQRKQLHQQFWSNATVPPPSVIARMERDTPGLAYSLFVRDAAVAAVLAGQLRDAGVPQETVDVLVPGVPDQYVVQIDHAARTVTIAPRA